MKTKPTTKSTLPAGPKRDQTGQPEPRSPVQNGNRNGIPILTQELRPEFAESFRMLAHSVEHSAQSPSLKALAVIGAYPGDGRSTVVANLGLALANRKHRVVLVDADNRSPSLRGALGVEDTVEMNDAPAMPRHNGNGVSLVKIRGRSLYVMAPQDPDTFVEQRAGSVLNSLRGSFDYILIDTAPCLGDADVFRLAAMADGALLVIRRRKQDLQQLQRILGQLRMLDVNVLGAVYSQI